MTRLAALAGLALLAGCSEYRVSCFEPKPPATPESARDGDGRPCEGLCIARVVPGNAEAIDVPEGCVEDDQVDCEDYVVLENRGDEDAELVEYDLERRDTAVRNDELLNHQRLGPGQCVALVASAEKTSSLRLGFDLNREWGSLWLLKDRPGDRDACVADVIHYGAIEPPCRGDEDVDDDGVLDHCAAMIDVDPTDGGWTASTFVADPGVVSTEPCPVEDDE